mmetsp:Transcript_3516/g.12667  ORF Transcript_3516/g.12667 Transcript_3516/m.12667 type:complete len:261 (+) Transcript_3516:123-905(+)
MGRRSARASPVLQTPAAAKDFSQMAAVSGLVLVPDFLTGQQERDILGVLDADDCTRWVELRTGSNRRGVRPRRVQHFGHSFDYATRKFERMADPVGCSLTRYPEPIAALIPQLTSELKARCAEHVGLTDPDQLTANEYTPGVGLSPHVDSHACFEGPIYIVSLLGHTVIEFRRGSNDDKDRPLQRLPLFMPARSLLIMTGEARLGWMHYIPHRRSDNVEGKEVPRPERRVSLTFRTIRRSCGCDCEYPDFCDSQKPSAVS